MISCVHTHTSFCDGSNTMEEMAAAAYKLGIKTFGFSGHSYYAEEDFGMKAEDLPAYFSTANKIKNEYANKMEILCGIEIDETMPKSYPYGNCDYIIGSSHAVKANDGKFYLVDHSADCFRDAVEIGFNNNIMLFAEEYYKQFSEFIKKIKPEIIGHLDLICKFNSKNEFFNESSKEYRDIALNATAELLKNNIVFEVNTGAISRKYMKRPYPDAFILKYICEHNGKVIITTDTHSVNTIDFYEKEAKELVKHIGFTTIVHLTANGFIEEKL